MDKKKKLQLRKEDKIIFILLGLGLLFVLMSYDYDNQYLSDAELDVKTALENEGYEILEVYKMGTVIMKESYSDTTSEQVFNGIHQMYLYFNYTKWHGFMVYIIGDDKACNYHTLLSNYPSYWKTLHGERVFVEYKNDASYYVGGYDSLDNLVFENVVKNADIKYNYNLSTFRALYWKSYPEVKQELLAPLVYHQVMDDPHCEESIEDF